MSPQINFLPRLENRPRLQPGVTTHQWATRVATALCNPDTELLRRVEIIGRLRGDMSGPSLQTPLSYFQIFEKRNPFVQKFRSLKAWRRAVANIRIE